MTLLYGTNTGAPGLKALYSACREGIYVYMHVCIRVYICKRTWRPYKNSDSRDPHRIYWIRISGGGGGGLSRNLYYLKPPCMDRSNKFFDVQYQPTWGDYPRKSPTLPLSAILNKENWKYCHWAANTMNRLEYLGGSGAVIVWWYWPCTWVPGRSPFISDLFNNAYAVQS